MKNSVKKGFGFGLTSGIITTLGLIVGLNAGTHSSIVIIGGIFVIAIADSMSDSLGMHISQEYENKSSGKEIWESTFSTFLFKFIFASTFAIPIFLLPLKTAVIASVIWGLLLIGIFSYHIARLQKVKPYKVIGEHIAIALIVIILTNYIGQLFPSV